MFNPWLKDLSRRLFGIGKSRTVQKPGLRAQLMVEPLEARDVPAVITVNSFSDLSVDLTDEVVTLRDAVHAANEDLQVSPTGPTGSGADTIRFDPGISGFGSIRLRGSLTYKGDLTIQGSLTLIEGSQTLFRSGEGAGNLTLDLLFLTSSNGGVLFASDVTESEEKPTVTITNSFIQRSRAASETSSVIETRSVNLVIKDTSITDNLKGRAAIVVLGANATITKTTMKGNEGSAIVLDASRDAATRKLTVTDSSITDNTGGEGAIVVIGADATITRTSIHGNEGSGIVLDSSGDSDTPRALTVTNSSIVNNGGDQGAIVVSNADATVTGTTISGNESSGIALIADVDDAAARTLTITNSTIVNNGGSGVELTQTGSGATMTGQYQNSIFAENTAGSFAQSSDTSGTATSLGNNILSDSPTSAGTPLASDMLNTDPKLRELTGSFHRLLQGSPAIDVGNDTAAPDRDQRGRLRFDGNYDRITVSDIGAVEFTNADPKISDQGRSLGENETTVGEITATDGDRPFDSITYTITGNGNDDDLFSISAEGILSFRSAPDFENPMDANRDNDYQVEVKVTDESNQSSMATVTVTVEPVNEAAPVFTSASRVTLPEGATTVLDLLATDADLPAPTMSFTLTENSIDDEELEIVNGNQLRFKNAPDFENPADVDRDNLYEIEVEANDGEGMTTRQTIIITITPVNEHAPAFVSPGIARIVEGSTDVLSLSATDADLPAQTITFSITDNGEDDSHFEIVNGNQLRFKTAPDFENPMDTNQDNIYVVEIEADDSNGMTSLQNITITVTPVNEHAPIFPSPATVTVREGLSNILSLAATDADLPAQTVSFALTENSIDGGVIEIVNGNQLRFTTAPDSEDPTDADRDNLYEVEIEATDGQGMTTLQSITITVVRAPDVLITSTDGTLNIQGDEEATDLQIIESSAPGEYTVQSIAPLRINGELSFSETFSGVTAIEADSGDGDDSIDLQGNAGADTTLLGALTITNASGSLDVLNTVGNFDVEGTVFINSTGDNLEVRLAQADNIFAEVEVADADGNTAVVLGNQNAIGKLTLSLGTGINTLEITNSEIHGDILALGPNLSDITFADTTVHGYASINDASAEPFSLSFTDVTMDDFLSVVAGDGDAVLILDGVTIHSLPGNAFGIGLAEGINTIMLNSSDLGGHFLTLADSRLSNVDITDSIIRGYATLNAPLAEAGEDVTVKVTDSTIDDWLSLVTGGGNDTLTLQNVNVLFANDNGLGIGLGQGINALTVTGGEISGNLFNLSDSALTTVNLNDTTIGGNTELHNTVGAMTVDLINSAFLGNLSITSGSGGDVINVASSRIVGETSITTNGGDDSVSLESSGADDIASDYLGAVNVQLGDGDHDVLDLATANDIDRARIFASATFDGGNGINDRLLDADLAFFSNGFTQQNFESAV